MYIYIYHMNFTWTSLHIKLIWDPQAQIPAIKTASKRKDRNIPVSKPFWNSDAQVEYIVYEAKGGIPGALQGIFRRERFALCEAPRRVLVWAYFVSAAGKDAGLSKKISQNNANHGFIAF